MSRQIRISIEDDEVFERLKRRKDALDLSWEDVLRRGLRDSAEPPRGSRRSERGADHGDHDDRAERRMRLHGRRGGRGGHPHHPGHHGHHSHHGPGEHGHGPSHGPGHARAHAHGHTDHDSPFDPEFGDRLAERIRSSLEPMFGGDVEAFGSVGEEGVFGGLRSLDTEIDRLEEAEDAVLVLGDDETEHVPLRVELHTGRDGLDVDVVAVRKGKDTTGMNRFGDGARAEVARRFASGETARLELADGEEVYDVRPDLTWARGPDGAPTVVDAAVYGVVFEDEVDHDDGETGDEK